MEALEGLERLEDLAQRRGVDRALGFALIERVRTQLHMGDAAAARHTLHALQALARRHHAPANDQCARCSGAAEEHCASFHHGFIPYWGLSRPS